MSPIRNDPHGPLRVLVWNVNGRNLGRDAAHLCRELEVHVLVLLECPDREAVLTELRGFASPRFDHVGLMTKPSRERRMRVEVFHRLSKGRVEEVSRSERGWTATRIRPTSNATRDLLLFALHLPSLRYADKEEQRDIARGVADSIREIERAEGLQRSIVAGDFNMNPHDEGMVGLLGFNATSDRTRASRGSRTHLGVERPFLYNPTWSLVGDIRQGTSDRRPAGSYHFARGAFLEPWWFCFDQMLLRPQLLSEFRSDEIRWIDEVGGTSMLTPGNRVPDAARFSDHLPLFFSLSSMSTE